MFNSSAAEAVFIIPTASWGSRLAVSQNHRYLYLKKWKREIIDPEELSDSLICGVNGCEELQVIARRKDGTLGWVKPEDYTFTFSGGGYAEALSGKRGVNLKGLKLTETPLELTVTLKERPELSASLSITVETPRQFWVMSDVLCFFDLKRRELLDEHRKPRRCSADELCCRQLSLLPGRCDMLKFLARYRDGSYAWVNNAEIQVGVSDPQNFEAAAMGDSLISVRAGEALAYGSKAELTVRSAADPAVCCRLPLVCQASHRNEQTDDVLYSVKDEYSVCMLTAFRKDLSLAANRMLNGNIFGEFARLLFGCKSIVMLGQESGACREEALLLFSAPARRDDFLTLLRSACLYFGWEHVVLWEGGSAYRFDSSGAMERLGDCALTVSDLERQYGAWRGENLRCGDVMDTRCYSSRPGGWISGACFLNALKELKQHKEYYFQEQWKSGLAGDNDFSAAVKRLGIDKKLL